MKRPSIGRIDAATDRARAAFGRALQLWRLREWPDLTRSTFANVLRSRGVITSGQQLMRIEMGLQDPSPSLLGALVNMGFAPPQAGKDRR